MKTKLIVAALASAFAFGSAVAATTTGISDAEYKAQKKALSDNYKSAKHRCDGMSGNAKDICQAEVKGEHEIAEKELTAAHKPTEKNQYDARVAKAEATYKVAKEKCDDLKGNDKDVCVKEAKANYTRAKGDAKIAKTVKTEAHNPSVAASGVSKTPEKVADAKRDAIEDNKEAQYKVAKEKCDAMSGQSKDNCVAEAKLKFSK
jgi:hypothetical protein